jgi:hypothetical protein
MGMNRPTVCFETGQRDNMKLRALPLDTLLKTQRIYSAVLRRLGNEACLRKAFDSSDCLHRITEAGVLQRNPGHTEEMVKEAADLIWLGPELHAKAALAKRGGQPISTEPHGMTRHEKTLVDLVGRLTKASVPYMLCGSHGCSFYGEPRATLDIDVVIDPDSEQLGRFIGSFGEGWVADLPAAQDALLHRTTFRILDMETGTKADFIIKKSRNYSDQELKRRVHVPWGKIRIAVVSPEDAVLSQLEWAGRGDSEIHFRDAVGVATRQWEELDRVYLRRWAGELGVSELLDAVLREAEEFQEGCGVHTPRDSAPAVRQEGV